MWRVTFFSPYEKLPLAKNRTRPPATLRVIKGASPPWKWTGIGLCLLRKTTLFSHTKATRLTLLQQTLTIWSIRLSMASSVFVRTQNPISFPNGKFTSLYNEHLTELRQQRRMGGPWRGWWSRTRRTRSIQDYEECCHVMFRCTD